MPYAFLISQYIYVLSMGCRTPFLLVVSSKVWFAGRYCGEHSVQFCFLLLGGRKSGKPGLLISLAAASNKMILLSKSRRNFPCPLMRCIGHRQVSALPCSECCSTWFNARCSCFCLGRGRWRTDCVLCTTGHWLGVFYDRCDCWIDNVYGRLYWLHWKLNNCAYFPYQYGWQVQTRTCHPIFMAEASKFR